LFHAVFQISYLKLCQALWGPNYNNDFWFQWFWIRR